TNPGYDSLGRKLRMTDPDMGTWTYSYDPLGNLASQTDAKNQTTTFAYDAIGRLMRKWYPASQCWTQDGLSTAHRVTVYDLMELRGWLDQYEQSAYGQTHRARAYYKYDDSDGTTQFGKGQRTALWDASGRATFTYDKAGRLTSEQRVIDGFVYTTSSTYDAAD